MNASWKTTTLGIVTLLTALANVLHAVATGETINWPEVLASITAGWGLIHARDNDKTSEQVGAAPAKTSFSGTRLGLWLLVAVLPIGMLAGSGCKAPAQRVAFNAVDVQTQTVQNGMRLFDDLVSQHKVPVATIRQVQAAYKHWQDCAYLEWDAAHAYAQAVGTTNAPAALLSQQLANGNLGQAYSDLVGLLTGLGLKL